MSRQYRPGKITRDVEPPCGRGTICQALDDAGFYSIGPVPSAPEGRAALYELMDEVDEMRAAILIALTNGRPTMCRIAQTSGISVRTMQRRLGIRGTTFSRLLLDVRQQAAYTMLRQTSMPLGAIAISLGYSELSSFTRAFHQWTGMSPSGFRNAAPGAEDRNLPPLANRTLNE